MIGYSTSNQKLDFPSSSVGNSSRGKEIYCINNCSTTNTKITLQDTNLDNIFQICGNSAYLYLLKRI